MRRGWPPCLRARRFSVPAVFQCPPFISARRFQCPPSNFNWVRQSFVMEKTFLIRKCVHTHATYPLPSVRSEKCPPWKTAEDKKHKHTKANTSQHNSSNTTRHAPPPHAMRCHPAHVPAHRHNHAHHSHPRDAHSGLHGPIRVLHCTHATQQEQQEQQEKHCAASIAPPCWKSARRQNVLTVTWHVHPLHSS